MRSKEDAQDYRYFPDPDLLPLEVSDALLAEITSRLPELPEPTRQRFVRDYDLTPYDAAQLTASRATADYFEALVKASGADPKVCANWQTGELAAALNRSETDISNSPISAPLLAGILARIRDGTLSGNTARKVFDVAWELGPAASVDAIIDQHGLRQISDAGAIEKLVDEVLAKNAKQVEDYRAGKDKAFNSLVGQVMKATQGKANPGAVNQLLKSKLGVDESAG
jgi:aspartyl-tRNA(Asn)/glutamyl-tRNA(Gln) amidotransferase subunit B